jgi:AAA domain
MKPHSDHGKSAAAHDSQQAALDAQQARPNPELVSRLKAHMASRGLDESKIKHRAIIGTDLGYADQTPVYRFLNDKWTLGDLGKFETRLVAFLENEMRIEGGAELINDPASFVLPSMFAFLNQVRACGNIGVAHGPAGIGKTCACRIYAAQNKQTTLYLHLVTWKRRQSAIVQSLLKAAGLKAGRGDCKEELLARHLRDNSMMLVLDNAQRLTRHSRDWLRDLLDDYGVPIALIGNPEIIAQWAAVDQHKRVVGLKRDVSVDLFEPGESGQLIPGETAEATVHHLLKRHFPEGSMTCKSEALKLLTHPGSGAAGALVMHARLASLMLKGGRITDSREAFRLAKTQLIQEAA